MAHVFGQRFWSFDVYQVRQKLLEDPILHSVDVEKVWPDEVHVLLKEVTPVARFGQQGLITEEGHWVSLGQHFSELGDASNTLAEPRRKALMALPQLVGEVQSRAALIEHYRLLRRMGWPIARLELTARGAWKLELHSGVMIELGSQHFSKRVHKVATIMQAYQDKMAEMQKIDARYPNGVAVKWRGTEEKTQQAVGAF